MPVSDAGPPISEHPGDVPAAEANDAGPAGSPAVKTWSVHAVSRRARISGCRCLPTTRPVSRNARDVYRREDHEMT